MKMKLAVMAVLLTTLIFSVTAGEAEEAWAPVDWQLYPAPAGGYVGDTMPFVTEDGMLELYYLYDTDHNGQGYIDDEKALSARIGHSTNGAHIGVFAEACDASFSNITMKLPE